MTDQLLLLPDDITLGRRRPAGQILKWVGNKFKYAEHIAQHLPPDLGTYYEPFVGTGAVLATLQPDRAVAGDLLRILVELHKLVQSDPNRLLVHYDECRGEILERGRRELRTLLVGFNTLFVAALFNPELKAIGRGATVFGIHAMVMMGEPVVELNGPSSRGLSGRRAPPLRGESSFSPWAWRESSPTPDRKSISPWNVCVLMSVDPPPDVST
jgi:hypothetical protein